MQCQMAAAAVALSQVKSEWGVAIRAGGISPPFSRLLFLPLLNVGAVCVVVSIYLYSEYGLIWYHG